MSYFNQLIQRNTLTDSVTQDTVIPVNRFPTTASNLSAQNTLFPFENEDDAINVQENFSASTPTDLKSINPVEKVTNNIINFNESITKIEADLSQKLDYKQKLPKNTTSKKEISPGNEEHNYPPVEIKEKVSVPDSGQNSIQPINTFILESAKNEIDEDTKPKIQTKKNAGQLTDILGRDKNEESGTRHIPEKDQDKKFHIEPQKPKPTINKTVHEVKTKNSNVLNPIVKDSNKLLAKPKDSHHKLSIGKITVEVINEEKTKPSKPIIKNSKRKTTSSRLFKYSNLRYSNRFGISQL